MNEALHRENTAFKFYIECIIFDYLIEPKCLADVRAGRLKKNTGETGLKQQKVSSKTKIKMSPIMYKLSFACINY